MAAIRDSGRTPDQWSSTELAVMLRHKMKSGSSAFSTKAARLAQYYEVEGNESDVGGTTHAEAVAVLHGMDSSITVTPSQTITDVDDVQPSMASITQPMHMEPALACSADVECSTASAI